MKNFIGNGNTMPIDISLSAYSTDIANLKPITEAELDGLL